MQKIETARLYLRQFTPEDLDELYCIYSDSEVMKYFATGVRSREATETAIHNYETDVVYYSKSRSTNQN